MPREPIAPPETKDPAKDDLASRLARAQEDVEAGRVSVYGTDAEFLASLERLEEGTPTVTQALSRVMGDVQSISKNSRNQAQNFNFRGIDAVMNAVGPALREHGVVVVPIKTKYEAEHYQTSNNKHMKGVTLTVTFRFYGPAGDHIDATATGEASDAGDKAMPKAHSVAFRTMLLQALCIPTDEPDPDLEAHDRAAMPFQEGATAQDPRPRAERSDGPAYNWPADWRGLGKRMKALLGEDEWKVWFEQAIEADIGQPIEFSDLGEDERRHVWGTLTKVLYSLDEELKVDPNAFPPPTRVEIAGEFAKHLDGAILNGPPWALDGAEAEKGYPAKAEVLGGAGVRLEPSEERKLAEESREPTDEEIEEAQATLDEEAAAAAELDRDQAHDASGK